MLKSISIKNFQSHKNTEILFSDGLNVISGSSDSGKSSIIRAIRWVTENRPSGDSIKNWDAKKEDVLSVSMELAEGGVCKERINGKAKYLLDSRNGSYEFEAFKTDVPEEVTDFFNLSEFNLQTQHDPYFLLNDSPGDVAKKLNSLVGLDIIDTIFKNLNSRILMIKRSITSEEELGRSLSEKIEKLSWIDDAETELSKLEEEENEVVELKSKFSDIKEIVSRYDSIAEELEKMKPLKSFEEPVKELIDDLLNLEKEKNKQEGVSSLVEGIDTLKKYIQEEDNSLEKNRKLLKNLLTTKNICPLCCSKITKEKIEEIIK